MENILPISKLTEVLKTKPHLLRQISDYGLANDGKHKYFVILKGTNRKIKFGDKNYEDFLIHKNPIRRQRYRTRHKNDHIDDPTKPGYWSFHLLW